MKRINLLALFVLVVFYELSGVTPMFPNRGSSSSSAPEQPATSIHQLDVLVQEGPTGSSVYNDSKVSNSHYSDRTKFEYTFKTSNGVPIFSNTALNTNIAYLYKNKMKIYAKNNNQVSYKLAFRDYWEAYALTNYIIAAKSAPYKKCTGRHAFKLEKFYEYGAAGVLSDKGPGWCMFRVQWTNKTAYMIGCITFFEDFRNVECIFREDEFQLTQLSDASDHYELDISIDGEITNPKFVLKISEPSKIVEFLNDE